MNKSRLYALIFVLLVVLGLGSMYLYEHVSLRNSLELHVMEDSEIPEIFKEMNKARLSKNAEVGLYDADNSRYLRFDLIANEILKEDILEGYYLLPGQYVSYGDYLVFKKGNALYAYSKLTGDIKEMNILVEEMDDIQVITTFDDKNVAMVYVSELIPEESGYAAVYKSTDRYLFDFNENSFEELLIKDPISGYGLAEKYSSDGSERLSWSVAPVVSLSLPLKLEDVDSGSERILFSGVEDEGLGSNAIYDLGFDKLLIVQNESKQYVDANGKIKNQNVLRNVAIVDLANNFGVQEYSYEFDRFDFLPWYKTVYDEDNSRLILASMIDYWVIELKDGKLFFADKDGGISLPQGTMIGDFMNKNGNIVYSDRGGIYIMDPVTGDFVAKSGIEGIKGIRLIDVFSAE